MIEWHFSGWKQLFNDGLASLPLLPHALLLSGDPGLGKGEFANSLVRLLLCEEPLTGTSGPRSCGKCQACRWIEGGNHPDFRLVAPEDNDDEEDDEAPRARKKGGAQIKIDAIRALEEFVFVGSHRQGRRIVLINPADAMNPMAANALLKILEEPPASVYFILVTSHPRRLLPTIRSRTRVLSFHRPAIDQGLRWLAQAGIEKGAARYLALAGGAPFLVRRWKEEGQLEVIDTLLDTLSDSPDDPVVLAGKWDGLLKKHATLSMEILVETVQRLLVDRTLAAAGLERRFSDGKTGMGGGASDSPGSLLYAWRDVLRFRRAARHPLNQTLFLEDLAVSFLRASRQGGGHPA